MALPRQSKGSSKIARRTPAQASKGTRNSGRSGRVPKNSREFAHAFLATIGEGGKSLTVAKKQGVFTQGDAADAVFYIQEGKVKLTVVSKIGKEATIGI